MRPAATRPRDAPTLYLAFELGNTEWCGRWRREWINRSLRRQMLARTLETLDLDSRTCAGHDC